MTPTAMVRPSPGGRDTERRDPVVKLVDYAEILDLIERVEAMADKLNRGIRRSDDWEQDQE